MHYENAQALAEAKADADFQAYRSQIDADEKRDQLAIALDAAVEAYSAAGHRRGEVVTAAVARYGPRIEREINAMLTALSAADDEVVKAKSAAKRASAEYGGAGLQLPDFSGGRIYNITTVTNTVHAVLDRVTRNELSR